MWYIELMFQYGLKYHHSRTELGQLDSIIDHAIEGMKSQPPPSKVNSDSIYLVKQIHLLRL
jgi:hypothetical protein